MYRSDIRESTINQLRDKVAQGNYGKYLREIVLQQVRQFNGVSIRFDFPVTALIGPNGGGKSTVLGAAALAYRSVRPRRFFAKSHVFDSSMQGWKIKYSLIDRDVRKNDLIQRTASFRESRWKRSLLDRDVVIFGISRTVPASEQTQFLKFARSTFEVSDEQVQQLAQEIADAASRILGWDTSRYRGIYERSEFIFLAAERDDYIQYSEFHFGAGEASIIRMVAKLESLADQSLILIEEVENGLHPMATLKMVEYLIDLAARKKVQVIFTTHSPDALLPLPPEAIWALFGDQAIQGNIDIRALRAIKGYIQQPRLVVYTEDEFAKSWIEMVIRFHKNLSLDEIEVFAMGGDGTAVNVHNVHNEDPAARIPSVCYIDGDSQQEESEENRVFRLPGDNLPPETYIYDAVMDDIESLKGRLTVALQLPFERQDEIANRVRDVRRDTRDHHLLFSKLGERLGFIPEQIVRGAFLSVWVAHYTDEAEKIAIPLQVALDNEA